MKNKGVFIVGTGTDIGKTYVTALLVKKLRKNGLCAAYYKAAASDNPELEGRLIPADAEFVKNVAHLEKNSSEMVSYVYREALSPHLAARLTGNFVDLNVIEKDFMVIAQQSDYVVVEGSGGILCPIVYESDIKIWLEDIIRLLQLPIVLVADAGLGTINSIGLTAYYLAAKNFLINGIILNRFDENNPVHIDNQRMIEDLTRLPIIGYVENNGTDLLRFNLHACMY